MSVVLVIMLFQLQHPLLHDKIHLFDVISFVWGAFCQQGTHLKISTTSGRFVVITTFLAALALFTSYSASIVALLQSPSNFVTTIDELIASPLKIGVHDAGYSRFYILHGNDTVINKVYEKKIKEFGEKAWIYDSFAGIERIRTGLYAFQIDSASAYKAISRIFTEYEKCSLSELQMIILPMTTIPVERHSGYRELFTQRYSFCYDCFFVADDTAILLLVSYFFYRIRWQREIGLINKEQRRWIPKNPECGTGGRGFLTVGLMEVDLAIKMLVIGTLFSAFLLFCKLLYNRMGTNSSNKSK